MGKYAVYNTSQLWTAKEYADKLRNRFPDSRVEDLIDAVIMFNDEVFPYRRLDFKKTELIKYLNRVKDEK